MLAVNLKSFTSDIFYNDKPLFALRWNWGYVLTFVLIWSYGFENVTFPITNSQSLLLTGGLAMVIFLLVYIGEKYKVFYEENIQILYSDIYIFGLLIVVFLILSVNNLSNSLVGDQLYHAQASQSQTIKVAEKLISYTHIPPTVEYKIILRAINIAFLAGMVVCIYALKRVGTGSRAVLLTALFLALKLLTNNSYNDPHPPLRLFPLWLNSTLFGLNDFSFRSISVFSLVVFAFILYKYGQSYFDRPGSLLTSLAVCSIPLLWHVASVVEQSIWTALSWSLILLFMQKDLHNPGYVRWLSIISTAGLMRASAFVGLMPVFLIIGFEFLKSREIKGIKTYLIQGLPVLVLIPFLIRTLIVGTPSTAESEVSALSKILLSFDGWFSVKVLYYNILLPWILFLPLFLASTIKNWFKVFVQISFFIAAYVIFYSINPYLWGVPRYQAELGIPFVILGFYTVFIFIYKKYPGYVKHFKFLLTLLILYNILIYTNLNWLNPPVDTWPIYFDGVKTGQIRILSEGEGVFNTNDALREARREGLSDYMCKAGITYGTFSEILNGYNIGEMIKVRSNFPPCSNWGPFNISEINEFQNIKLILFIDKHNKQNEIQEFLDSGQWVVWRRFYNEKFGSSIIGIKRKE